MTDRQEARQRAEITRRANAEKKKQWRAEHDRQEAADRATVAAAMRAILGDENATPRERIFAALTLDGITGNLVPWRAEQLYNNDADTAAFKRAVDAITAAEGKDSAQADA